MGCIGAIFRFIGFCLIVALVVGLVMGIVITRKWLMSDSEVEKMEQQYKVDTSAVTKKQPWSHKSQQIKNKRKGIP